MSTPATEPTASSPRPLHVLIAGGGLGGLALAQGLIADGHTVEVFERDADSRRRQGYYLTINGDGGQALQRLLPPDLFELYLDTSRRPYETQASVVRNPRLEVLGARPSMGPPNLGERRHTGVDRRTLRRILGTRIEEHVRWGTTAESYAEDEDGVTLTLGDGSTAHGDLLVIAAGIHSRLRDQRLPGTRVVSTAITGIDLYARAPYTPQLLAQIPDELHDSMLIVAGPHGTRCLLASFRPRRPIAEAGAAVPGADLEPVDDYMMVSCSVLPETVIPPAAEWTEQTRADIVASMAQVVAEWDPAVRAIVEAIDPDSLFSIAFSYLEPVQDWSPSRVTVLGDAAHGMLPTLGMGANSAIRDASVLADRLAEVAAGRTGIAEAVGAYEAEMRGFAYPLIAITVDHDNVFGGGALARTDVSA
ncbi:FAD-dependent oxidoreductase [uncultured Amnibacterium sp.]|uniref:FAD-dependent oxidoreductase n=1 Tax=uncultured Amnibacterium sp. TaxID=1631851 RepID=UPI0035CC4BFF